MKSNMGWEFHKPGFIRAFKLKKKNAESAIVTWFKIANTAQLTRVTEFMKAVYRLTPMTAVAQLKEGKFSLSLIMMMFIIGPPFSIHVKGGLGPRRYRGERENPPNLFLSHALDFYHSLFQIFIPYLHYLEKNNMIPNFTILYRYYLKIMLIFYVN